MAVEAGFYLDNLGFLSTNPNNHPSLQQMGMVMGMGCNVGDNQGMIYSYPSSSFTSTAAADGSDNSLPFAALLDKHKREVDLYLHLQGERLKEALHQQKWQQMQYLLNTFESRTMVLMREKDEELEKQRAKTKLLEEYLKRSEDEAEVWQRIAKEKEETVIELNNMLLTIQQNMSFSQQNDVMVNDRNDDDAESVCDCETIHKNDNERVVPRESKEIIHQGNGGKVKDKIVCKWCNYGKLCVLFLPCKHLCCCKECESVLGLCPVCYSVKQTSMEIFFP